MPSFSSIAVAIGAFLAGVGSALSGYAAWKIAHKRNEDKKEEGE